MKRNKAIAFDFDGTLVNGGLDKSIHIMFSAWMACYHTGFREYLSPDNPEHDVEMMLSSYLEYPGAPRFQQLAGIVNNFVNQVKYSFNSLEGLKVGKPLQEEYDDVRNLYNETYSKLNTIAAKKYWKPFPSAKSTIAQLARNFDLFIASGVTRDILIDDLDFHAFNQKQFVAIEGGDINGGNDKGTILKRIKSTGYVDILFVGDSTKDYEYAHESGVKFFRIQNDDDFHRLLKQADKGFPETEESWVYSKTDLEILRNRTAYLLRGRNRDMTYSDKVDYINSRM